MTGRNKRKAAGGGWQFAEKTIIQSNKERLSRQGRHSPIFLSSFYLSSIFSSSSEF
jgi:hypothetical protein